MELLCGLPNTNLDVLLQQLIPCSSKNDNWLSCANFLRLMFYASVLAACLLLSLILSTACCALPGMARRLEFPSSTSPGHYPEGCAAHSMALTRPWRACTGLCMVVYDRFHGRVTVYNQDYNTIFSPKKYFLSNGTGFTNPEIPASHFFYIF